MQNSLSFYVLNIVFSVPWSLKDTLAEFKITGLHFLSLSFEKHIVPLLFRLLLKCLMPQSNYFAYVNYLIIINHLMII